MCLWNTDAPGGNKVEKNMAKISKSYILTPPHPQGHVMSVKCEQPIDELTVQVWLLYHNPNFKYCTLFVSGTGRDGITDGQTDKRTNRRTDDPNTRCPRRTFQAGGIKMGHVFCFEYWNHPLLTSLWADRGFVSPPPPQGDFCKHTSSDRALYKKHFKPC